MFDFNNNLYANITDKDFILYTHGGVIIPFNKTWKAISVRLSGGADSALLTYILCKIITEHNLDCEIHAISFIRNWATRPWQDHVSQTVFNKLAGMFTNIKFVRHPGFIPPSIEHGALGGPIVPFKEDGIIKYETGEAIVMQDFDKFVAGTYKTRASYVGITSNPPIQESKRRELPERNLNLDTISLRKLLSYNIQYNSWYVVPLRYISKDWVVSQFKDENILDLYSLTRSCEGDITEHHELTAIVPTFNDYKPGMFIPTCNKCWWCWERNWAEVTVGLKSE
jgi:hypothetical protein